MFWLIQQNKRKKVKKFHDSLASVDKGSYNIKEIAIFYNIDTHTTQQLYHTLYL